MVNGTLLRNPLLPVILNNKPAQGHLEVVRIINNTRYFYYQYKIIYILILALCENKVPKNW